jgi:PilZ domain-containing protein
MMGSPASIALFPNQGQPPEPEAAADGAEKRNAPRYPASEVPSITGLRLSPHGAEATLVNISTTGLLAECAVRLKTGSTVTVQFEGTFTPTTVQGRVARCSVARVSNGGTLLYHVGLSFTEAITLPAELERAAAAAAETSAAPAAAAVPQQTDQPSAIETSAPAPAPPPVEHVRPTLRNRW